MRGGAEVCPQAISVSEYGAAWLSPGTLSLTAPPGTGWTARLALVARKRDGARLEWTEDTLLSAETAQYTVGLAPGDDGAVMLLVARVSYVNADGRQLHSVGLRGRFVFAREGAYTESEETFTSYISETPFVDPHAGLDLDEEVAP